MAKYIDQSVAIARLTHIEVTKPTATMTDAKRALADMFPADVEPMPTGLTPAEIKKLLDVAVSKTNCEECPAFMTDFCTVNVEEQSQETAGEVVRVVEEWSAAHPRKTRQSVFLEQYPEARIGDDGVLKVCPFLISASYRNNDGICAAMQRQCSDCRKDFWGQEVE